MSKTSDSLHCPDCGSPLSSEAWGEDLCLVCLMKLGAPTLGSDTAATAPGLTLAPEAGEEATAHPGGQSVATDVFEFSRGAVLADRYRVLKRLGRGGMGEVWRAYDLKLRVDVALKSLNAALAGEHGLELMRGEVRAAREVISPNVCRIFDLIEVDGHELVSMEYVDGHTLVRTLDERGPLDLQEAADVGSQLLAGLEAIHSAGLVHRDIKPENIMLTRARRIVIMDFGLTARAGEGMHAGTPAYMPPEQKRGEGTDARADIFSAGIVLAELLAVGGDAADAIRHDIWKAIRETPPSLPEIPWRRILLKAIATDREDRYESAAAMTRTLEKIAIRVSDAENKTPYPGLAAYDCSSAEFFFGREAEVEALWKKLQHANLLGLVGASGTGKSSFVQAGLLPASPEGWSHLQFKPRQSPFAALARALAAMLPHDPAAQACLQSPEDPERILAALAAWRQQHREVLLIVDQFEELFTQNDLATQTAFADLLAQLAFECEVHVLVSMRDDFLMRCNEFPSLAPIFSELTPLKPPFGSALRRAIVHPALKCGYRFENESIVEEMLAEVTRERAALPLIAFTAARLWDERERDTGLLTQEAYDRLGGVAGALAQHAESALSAIGEDRIPIVRELFRNLVTAQGTRATVEFDELQSLFEDDDRDQEAAEVLQALIDARLLTSYEVQTEEGALPTRRVEVVHESLLSAWPRLVRWRAQDAESLQLRDELRQAARLWDSRGRSDDLLWMGTAYREFRLWRERYPGRLTSVEDAFVNSMTTAGERARKRRQRVLTGVIAVLLVVVAGVTMLWRQSEADRLRAVAQTMVAQAKDTLDSFSTETLAWAIRSLEVADTREGRLLALQALWKSPPAWQVNDYAGLFAQFSPDGGTLLQTPRRSNAGGLLNMIRSDGSSTIIRGGHDTDRIGAYWQAGDADLLVSTTEHPDGSQYGWEHGLWSASQGRNLGLAQLPESWEFPLWNAELGGAVQVDPEGAVLLAAFDGEPARHLGKVPGGQFVAKAGDATWFAQIVDDRVETVAIGPEGIDPAQQLGRHPGATVIAVNGPSRRVATRDDSGLILVWDAADRGTGEDPPAPVTVVGPAGRAGALRFSSDGGFFTFRHRDPAATDRTADLWAVTLADGEASQRRLGSHLLSGAAIRDASRKQVGALISGGGSIELHRLSSPEGAQSLTLHPGAARNMVEPSFHPSGNWIAAQHSWLTVWSLARPYPVVIPVAGRGLLFDPEGKEIIATSTAEDGTSAIFAWPLEGAVPGARRLVSSRAGDLMMKLSPDGRTLALGGRPDGRTSPLFMQRDGTGERQVVEGFVDAMNGSAFSPDGRLFAGVGGQFEDTERVVKVWDVTTGELVATHHPEAQGAEVPLFYTNLTFAGSRQLIWSGDNGTYRWDLDLDEHFLLDSRSFVGARADDSGELVVGMETKTGKLFAGDVAAGLVTELTAYGTDVRAFTLSPDGRILATADIDGVVRVGAPTNAEPHLLYSHTGIPNRIAIDPQGRWVATSSDDEIRLWPMPDISEPPLHTLPYNELLAKLRSLTNVRLVEDPDAPEGWSLTFEPFPGWEKTPMW